MNGGKKVRTLRKKFNLPDYWASVGFIVGEGHINYAGTTPLIRVAQVEKQPLLQLKKLYGGRIYGPFKYTTNRKPYWYWGVSGKTAAGAIMTLLPGLKIMSKKKYNQGIKTLKIWRRVGRTKYA